jgi:hypothetical protein
VHHDKTYATQGLDQFQVKTFLDPDWLVRLITDWKDNFFGLLKHAPRYQTGEQYLANFTRFQYCKIFIRLLRVVRSISNSRSFPWFFKNRVWKPYMIMATSGLIVNFLSKILTSSSHHNFRISSDINSSSARYAIDCFKIISRFLLDLTFVFTARKYSSGFWSEGIVTIVRKNQTQCCQYLWDFKNMWLLANI